MVVFYSKRGQLANRLWQAAYLVSNSIENNYTFLHLGFGEYAVYFSENIIKSENYGKCYLIDFKTTSLKNRITIRVSKALKFLNKKLKGNLPFVKDIYFLNYIDRFDISDRSFLELAQKRMALVDGWLFMDRKSLSKHSEAIRNIFRPNQVYIDNVENILRPHFQKFEVIIGVHMRKGDYAQYRNGIWLYSNVEYELFINQVSLLPIFKNKKVAFLLCSNEKINLKDFEGHNILLATNHFIEDLYALSICDYIVGPPSTFSSWASFFGKTPLLHIDRREMVIRQQDFKIFESY